MIGTVCAVAAANSSKAASSGEVVRLGIMVVVSMRWNRADDDEGAARDPVTIWRVVGRR